MTLRIISQGERTSIVPAYFVDSFVFLCTELSTSLLISPSLASAKSIFVVVVVVVVVVVFTTD